MILIGFVSLIGLTVISPANALEFEPMIARNANNSVVFAGIVGQPIIFETVITNNEVDTESFEIAFTTRTVNDKILDHQKQHIVLKYGETTTVSYQFVPTTEGNYVSGIFYGKQPFSDIVTFPALEENKIYPKQTVLIYSDSSDDCIVACTDPSVVNIDVGTVVEWHNMTPDKRSVSTGNYVEHKDGISWSSTDGFHSTIIPERISSFLFSQSGEFQLFLAEHRTQDLIGTVHVMFDQFREADKTFNILNKIMNDNEFGIPISSLSINPKNSVITVGINDKRNSLFTLDVYKTMLYKDPVVKQFLQSYPSATFEHFKTPDEPGNPRTYSEFHYEIFLLRVLVLTYGQQGVCYPVWGYTIGYDDQTSETKGLFENIYVKSDGISQPISKVKKLSTPYEQTKSGIDKHNIQCTEEFTLLLKPETRKPVCVTGDTAKKLIGRHWAVPVSRGM